MNHPAWTLLIVVALAGCGDDDGAIEPRHFKRAGCTVGRLQFVVCGDHVAPPNFFNVALQFNAQWPVVPKPIDPAIYLGRLKYEAPAFAQRDDLLHAVVCL